MQRPSFLLAFFVAVITAFPVISEEIKGTAATPPYRLLSRPTIGRTQITDTFWAPRIKTSRDVALPYAFDVCGKTGRISNFEKAAGKLEGKFEGIWFNDSDVYKIIQGAAYELAIQHDEKLDKLTDEVIAKIAAAQQADG